VRTIQSVYWLSWVFTTQERKGRNKERQLGPTWTNCHKNAFARQRPSPLSFPPTSYPTTCTPTSKTNNQKKITNLARTPGLVLTAAKDGPDTRRTQITPLTPINFQPKRPLISIHKSLGHSLVQEPTSPATPTFPTSQYTGWGVILNRPVKWFYYGRRVLFKVLPFCYNLLWGNKAPPICFWFAKTQSFPSTFSYSCLFLFLNHKTKPSFFSSLILSSPLPSPVAT